MQSFNQEIEKQHQKLTLTMAKLMNLTLDPPTYSKEYLDCQQDLSQTIEIATDAFIRAHGIAQKQIVRSLEDLDNFEEYTAVMKEIQEHINTLFRIFKQLRADHHTPQLYECCRSARADLVYIEHHTPRLLSGLDNALTFFMNLIPCHSEILQLNDEFTQIQVCLKRIPLLVCKVGCLGDSLCEDTDEVDGPAPLVDIAYSTKLSRAKLQSTTSKRVTFQDDYLKTREIKLSARIAELFSCCLKPNLDKETGETITIDQQPELPVEKSEVVVSIPRNRFPGADASISNIFERFYLIDSFTWNVSHVLGTTLYNKPILDTILRTNIPPVGVLRHHLNYLADYTVEIRINSYPQSVGSIQLHYIPNAGMIDLPVAVNESFTILPHARISVGYETVCSLNVKHHMVESYIPLTLNGYPKMDSRLFVVVWNPLRAGTAMPTVVTAHVWIKFNNVNVSVKTPYRLIYQSGDSAYEKWRKENPPREGTISYPAGDYSAEDIAATLGQPAPEVDTDNTPTRKPDVPENRAYLEGKKKRWNQTRHQPYVSHAGRVDRYEEYRPKMKKQMGEGEAQEEESWWNWILRGAGNIGSLISGVAGVGKLVAGFFDQPSIFEEDRSVGMTDKPMHVVSLRNHIAQTGQYVDMEPIQLKKYLQIPIRFASFPFNAAAPADSLLFQTIVGPQSQASENQNTILNDLCQNFTLWRGTIMYKIEIIACRFHQAQLLVGITYVSDAAALTNAQVREGYYASIDIGTQNTLEVAVPFVWPKDWAQVQLDLPTYLLPRLTIWVQNPLIAPNIVSNIIDINVYKYAGEDFEFNGSKGPDCLILTPQSGDSMGRGGMTGTAKMEAEIFRPFDASLAPARLGGSIMEIPYYRRKGWGLNPIPVLMTSNSYRLCILPYSLVSGGNQATAYKKLNLVNAVFRTGTNRWSIWTDITKTDRVRLYAILEYSVTAGTRNGDFFPVPLVPPFNPGLNGTAEMTPNSDGCFSVEIPMISAQPVMLVNNTNLDYRVTAVSIWALGSNITPLNPLQFTMQLYNKGGDDEFFFFPLPITRGPYPSPGPLLVNGTQRFPPLDYPYARGSPENASRSISDKLARPVTKRWLAPPYRVKDLVMVCQAYKPELAYRFLEARVQEVSRIFGNPNPTQYPVGWLNLVEWVWRQVQRTDDGRDFWSWTDNLRIKQVVTNMAAGGNNPDCIGQPLDVQKQWLAARFGLTNVPMPDDWLAPIFIQDTAGTLEAVEADNPLLTERLRFYCANDNDSVNLLPKQLLELQSGDTIVDKDDECLADVVAMFGLHELSAAKPLYQQFVVAAYCEEFGLRRLVNVHELGKWAAQYGNAGDRLFIDYPQIYSDVLWREDGSFLTALITPFRSFAQAVRDLATTITNTGKTAEWLLATGKSLEDLVKAIKQTAKAILNHVIPLITAGYVLFQTEGSLRILALIQIVNHLSQLKWKDQEQDSTDVGAIWDDLQSNSAGSSPGTSVDPLEGHSRWFQHLGMDSSDKEAGDSWAHTLLTNVDKFGALIDSMGGTLVGYISRAFGYVVGPGYTKFIRRQCADKVKGSLDYYVAVLGGSVVYTFYGNYLNIEHERLESGKLTETLNEFENRRAEGCFLGIKLLEASPKGTNFEWLEKTFRTLLKIRAENEFPLTPTQNASIRSLFETYHNACRLNRLDNSQIEPVGLYFAGSPGVGKSLIVSNYLARTILHKCGLPSGTDQVFRIPSGEVKHWDNYKQQGFAYFDDFMQERDGSDAVYAIQVISTSKCPLSMASLEEKGMLFDSKFVAASSNLTSLDTANTIVCREALARRFSFAYQIELNAAYKLASGKLDYAKLVENITSVGNSVEAVNAVLNTVWSFRAINLLDGKFTGPATDFSHLTEAIVKEYKSRVEGYRRLSTLIDNTLLRQAGDKKLPRIITGTRERIGRITRVGPNWVFKHVGRATGESSQSVTAIPPLDSVDSAPKAVKDFMKWMRETIVKMRADDVSDDIDAHYYSQFLDHGQHALDALDPRWRNGNNKVVRELAAHSILYTFCVKAKYADFDILHQRMMLQLDRELEDLQLEAEGRARSEWVGLFKVMAIAGLTGFAITTAMVALGAVLKSSFSVLEAYTAGFSGHTSRTIGRATQAARAAKIGGKVSLKQEGSDVQEKIRRNLRMIKFTHSMGSNQITQHFTALWVNDRQFLMPRHSMETYKERTRDYELEGAWISTHNHKNEHLAWRPITLDPHFSHLLKGNEWNDTLLCQSQTAEPAIRDIIGFFISKEDKIHKTRNPGVLLGYDNHWETHVSGDINALIGTYAVHNFSPDPEGKTQATMVQARLETPSTNGDCGRPYVLGSSSHHPIVGLHSLHHNCVVGLSVVWQEELIAASDKLFTVTGTVPLELEDCHVEVKKPNTEFWTEDTMELLGPMRLNGVVLEHHSPPTTNLVKLRQYGIILKHPDWDCPMRPAAQKVVQTVNGPVHPLVTNAQKYGPKAKSELPWTTMHQLVKYYSTRFPETRETRVYTLEEAINGTEDGRMQQLKMDTSCGYWSRWFKEGKKELFTPLPATEYEGIIERTRYRLSDRAYTDILPIWDCTFAQRLDSCEEMLKERVVPMHLWVATTKDEVRSNEKVALGKTRVFEQPGMEFVLLVRRYFGAFLSWFKDEAGFKLYHGIGKDKETVWHLYARGLSNHSILGHAFDYSNWDGTVGAQAFEFFRKITDEFYSQGTLEDMAVRHGLLSILRDGHHIMGTQVYKTRQGNKSGNPMTDVFNSVCNTFVMYQAWVVIKEIQGIWGGITDFDEKVRMLTYGDDLIMTVEPDSLEWFNGPSIAAVCKQFGYKITDAQKSATVPDHQPFHELSFLKSHFVTYENEGEFICLPTLPKQDIYKELCYCPKNCNNDPDDLRQRVRNTLRFMAGNGKKDYEEFRFQLIQRGIPKAWLLEEWQDIVEDIRDKQVWGEICE